MTSFAVVAECRADHSASVVLGPFANRNAAVSGMQRFARVTGMRSDCIGEERCEDHAWLLQAHPMQPATGSALVDAARGRR